MLYNYKTHRSERVTEYQRRYEHLLLFSCFTLTIDLCSMDSLSLDDHLVVRQTPTPTPPVAVTVTAPEGITVKNCVKKVNQKVTPECV